MEEAFDTMQGDNSTQQGMHPTRGNIIDLRMYSACQNRKSEKEDTVQ